MNTSRNDCWRLHRLQQCAGACCSVDLGVTCFKEKKLSCSMFKTVYFACRWRQQWWSLQRKLSGNASFLWARNCGNCSENTAAERPNGIVHDPARVWAVLAHTVGLHLWRSNWFQRHGEKKRKQGHLSAWRPHGHHYCSSILSGRGV